MTPIPQSFFELAAYKTGDFIHPPAGGPAIGYCYDIVNAACQIIWFGNSEISAEDFARHGDQLRRLRLAEDRRQIDKRKGKVDNRFRVA